MTDKELNELLEYNQEYMDARLSEDVFGGDYTSQVELKYLKKDYDKLQSNWNRLREYVIQLQKLKGINQQCFSWGVAQEVLDKMNELEGVDNENK